MREGCKENETILENHGESFTRFQKVSKQAVAELCQAQVKFKLELGFQEKICTCSFKSQIKRLKKKDLYAIQMQFRSTYQKFDQQIICQNNRLTSEQMQFRCTKMIFRLQFRWNLD